MNVADSEVVAAILQQHHYILTGNPDEADLVLVNTCSIRENAEHKVRMRLKELGQLKHRRPGLFLGVIGCMAERLSERLLEDEPVVDLVAGPDAYRELPSLLRIVEEGERGVNTVLSRTETYADIEPVRMDRNGVTAFVSIMRGCNNFCSYCVVPGTRGRERSREPETILRETEALCEKGYREVTLLGQNVNSYRWKENGNILSFPGLLDRVARIDPGLRIRFATSHPKDLSDDLLEELARHPNLCRSIHLPVQSGSSEVLKRMNRKYTREHYMGRIEAIRAILPEASVSTDIIAGFSGETEEEHRQTLDLMQWAGYDFAYMFKYSERPETYASRHYPDDIPDEIKGRRLREIIDLQMNLSLASKQKDIGQTLEVLAEGTSKKSPDQLYGRTTQNKVVVFPKENYGPGDYVKVAIRECTPATLKGVAV